ncbi:MAG TPA: YkvA family protein, partial [Planctomycetaceae bacterium]
GRWASTPRDHDDQPPMSDLTPTTLPAEGYSDESFWDKVARFAKRAGREVIEKALWLHYAAQDEKTPVWAKTTMYGALAYFILPADMIPDLIPGAGFTDDLGALAAALTTVAIYVTPEVKARAAKQVAHWFGAEETAPPA